MSHQSEAILESNLIKQLVVLGYESIRMVVLGYESIRIHDGDAFLFNLQSQLESFNKTKFTGKEFSDFLQQMLHLELKPAPFSF